jgi:hypothetical protein
VGPWAQRGADAEGGGRTDGERGRGGSICGATGGRSGAAGSARAQAAGVRVGGEGVEDGKAQRRGAEGRCGCDGLREGGVNDTTVNNRLDRYQKLSTKICLDFATILLARSSINTN